VSPADWQQWLAGKGVQAPKSDALKALKDAKLIQRVYKLPGEQRSMGLYTGPAPRGTASLPKRPSRQPKA
jgi:hypothetical protein